MALNHNQIDYKNIIMEGDKKKQSPPIKVGYFIDYYRYQKYIDCEVLQVQGSKLTIQGLKDDNVKDFIDVNSNRIKPYRTYTKPTQNYTIIHKFYNYWSESVPYMLQILQRMYSSTCIEEEFTETQIVQFLKGKQFYLIMSLVDAQNVTQDRIQSLTQYIRLFLQFFIKYWDLLKMDHLNPLKLYASPHHALMLSYPELLISVGLLMGRCSFLGFKSQNKTERDSILNECLEWMQQKFIPKILSKDLQILNFQILYRLANIIIKLVGNRISKSEQNLNSLNKLIIEMRVFIPQIAFGKYNETQIQINNLLQNSEKNSQYQFHLKCRKLQLYIKYLDLLNNQTTFQMDKSARLFKMMQFVINCAEQDLLLPYVKIYLQHDYGLNFYVKNAPYTTYSHDFSKLFVLAKKQFLILIIRYRKIQAIKSFMNSQNLTLIKMIIQVYFENCTAEKSKDDLTLGIDIHKSMPIAYKNLLSSILQNLSKKQKQKNFDFENMFNYIEQEGKRIVIEPQTKEMLSLLYELESNIISLCTELYDGQKTLIIDYVVTKILVEHTRIRNRGTVFQSQSPNLFKETFIINSYLDHLINSSQSDLQTYLLKLKSAFMQLCSSMVALKTKNVLQKRKQKLIKILSIICDIQENITVQLICFYISKVKQIQNKQFKLKSYQFMSSVLNKLKGMSKNWELKVQAFKKIMKQIKIQNIGQFRFFIQLFKIVNEHQNCVEMLQDSFTPLVIYKYPYLIQYLLEAFVSCLGERAIIKRLNQFFNKIQLKILNPNIKQQLMQELVSKLLDSLLTLTSKTEHTKIQQQIIEQLTHLLLSFTMNYADVSPQAHDFMYDKIFDSMTKNMPSNSQAKNQLIKVKVIFESLNDNKDQSIQKMEEQDNTNYQANISGEQFMYFLKSKFTALYKISPLLSNFYINNKKIQISEQNNTIYSIYNTYYKNQKQNQQYMEEDSQCVQNKLKQIILHLRVQPQKYNIKKILLQKINYIYLCLPYTLELWSKLQISNSIWEQNEKLKQIKNIFLKNYKLDQSKSDLTNSEKQKIQFSNKLMLDSYKKKIILQALLNDIELENYKINWIFDSFSSLESKQDIENNLLLMSLVQKTKPQLNISQMILIFNMLKIDEKMLSQDELQDINSAQTQYQNLIRKAILYINQNANFCIFSHIITFNSSFFTQIENCPKFENYFNDFLICAFSKFLNKQKRQNFPHLMMFYLQKYTLQFEYFIKVLQKVKCEFNKHLNQYELFENLLQLAIQTIISYPNFKAQVQNNFAIMRTTMQLITCFLAKSVKCKLIFSQQFKRIIEKTIYSKLSAQAMQIITFIIQQNQKEGQQYVRIFYDQLDEPEWEKKQCIKFNKHNLRHESGYVGLKNPHSICYINSLLQQLYHTKQFRQGLYMSSWKQNDAQEQDLILQLKRIFINLNLRQTDSYINNLFFNAFKNDEGGPTSIDIQMDVDEFRSILFDRIQNLIIKSQDRKNNFVQQTFNGKQVTLIKSKECEHQSSREQEFSSICLQVKGLKNLQNSLQNYFKPQILNEDNMYFCDECKKKVVAQKTNQIKQYPKNLIFVLKRFEYVHQYKKKINENFEFPLHNFNMAENEHYKLKGIIVHQGISEAGHYFSIIKLKDKWYEFNDNFIGQLTEEEVVNYSYGEQSPRCNRNAYLIIYEKINEKNQQIQELQKQKQEELLQKLLARQKVLQQQMSQISTFNHLIWKSDLFLSHQFQTFVKTVVQLKIKNSLNLLLKYIITIKSKIYKFDLAEYKILFQLLDEYLENTVLSNQTNAELAQIFYKQRNLQPSLKTLLTNIIVKKHEKFDSIMKRFLKHCVLAIHDEETETAQYFQLFLELAKKDQQILHFLINARIVGRVYDITVTKYLLALQRDELAKSSLQVPFPLIQSYKIDKKKMSEAKQLRYHKWKLVNFIIESNIKLNTTQTAYLTRWCERKYSCIFQDATTKANINQISKLFCLTSARSQAVARSYLKQICKQICMKQSQSARKFLKAASDLLSIQDAQKIQRSKAIKSAFAQAFKILNDHKIMTSFDIKWQWFMKIAIKYSDFLTIVRRSADEFKILNSKSDLQTLYTSRMGISSQGKDKNKYYGLKFSSFSSNISNNNFFQEKFQKNKIIFNSQFDDKLKKIREEEPDYDSDLTDFQDILKPQSIIYKFNQSQCRFSQAIIENVIGNIIQVNQTYFQKGDEKLMPCFIKQEIKQQQSI